MKNYLIFEATLGLGNVRGFERIHLISSTSIRTNLMSRNQVISGAMGWAQYVKLPFLRTYLYAVLYVPFTALLLRKWHQILSTMTYSSLLLPTVEHLPSKMCTFPLVTQYFQELPSIRYHKIILNKYSITVLTNLHLVLENKTGLHSFLVPSW